MHSKTIDRPLQIAKSRCFRLLSGIIRHSLPSVCWIFSFINAPHARQCRLMTYRRHLMILVRVEAAAAINILSVFAHSQATADGSVSACALQSSKRAGVSHNRGCPVLAWSHRGQGSRDACCHVGPGAHLCQDLSHGLARGGCPQGLPAPPADAPQVGQILSHGQSFNPVMTCSQEQSLFQWFRSPCTTESLQYCTRLSHSRSTHWNLI